MPATTKTLTKPDMTWPLRWLAMGVVALALAWAVPLRASEIASFVGSYSGSADVVSADGSTSKRDMSVEITEDRDGFTVEWTTTTYKDDGRVKEQTYEIDFVDSDRDDVFAAAMRKNVFGHAVQLDPMKGDPYVWSQLRDDTLTVYSLFISADGGYEMQQYDRTLVAGGLQLEFQRIRNGVPLRTVSAMLTRD